MSHSPKPHRVTDAELAAMQEAVPEVSTEARTFTGTDVDAAAARAVVADYERAVAAATPSEFRFRADAQVIATSGQGAPPTAGDDRGAWRGMHAPPADPQPIVAPPTPPDINAPAPPSAEVLAARLAAQGRRMTRCRDCYGKGVVRRRRTAGVNGPVVSDKDGKPVYGEIDCACVSGRGDPSRRAVQLPRKVAATAQPILKPAGVPRH